MTERRHYERAQSVHTLGSGRPTVAVETTWDHSPGAYERLVKPIVDRVLAALLILLALPLIVAIALVIRVTMGSPVLLRQARVGRNGRVFLIFKFRTMRPDRRAAQRPFRGPDRRVTHKSPHDPRLTPVGRFLRRWSLDELPQLWNVVRGEMSLVGPRPEMVEVVVRQYEPWQHRRHAVKPGLTGLWQISARGDGPMHENTHVDLEYLEQISLRTDLRILALTLPAALGVRRGF